MDPERETEREDNDTPEEEASESIDVRRIVTLIVVLVALIGLTVVTKMYYRSKRSANIQASLALAKTAQVYLDKQQYLDAGETLENTVTLYDGDLKTMKTYIAVMFRLGALGGDFTLRGVKRLNQLVEQHPKEMVVDFNPLAYDVVKRFGAAGPRISDVRLGEADVKFMNDTGFVWSIDRRLTDGAANDAERVLLVLGWLRRNVLPLEATRLPALPRDVLYRGYAGPPQLMWTFGDMVQQLGLKSYVLDMVSAQGKKIDRRLMAVDIDGKLLLFDPVAGIPLLAASDHHILSFNELKRNPAALIDLKAEGVQYAIDPKELSAVYIGIVCHPYMLLPRMKLVSELMAPIKSHQTFAVDLAQYLKPWVERNFPAPNPDNKLPVGQVKTGPALDVWGIPFATIMKYNDPSYQRLRRTEYWGLRYYQPGRDLVLRGMPKNADDFYVSLGQRIATLTKNDEVYQKSDYKKQMDEDLAFFAVQAMAFSGSTKEVRQKLEEFLKTYPKGMWHLLVMQELAECVEKLEGREAARPYWKKLPVPRAAYGALRAMGILPLVTPKAVEQPQ